MITSGKIRELSILYNAQINIPNQQSTSTTVKITGKPTILADLEKALLDLAEEVKDKEPVVNFFFFLFLFFFFKKNPILKN